MPDLTLYTALTYLLLTIALIGVTAWHIGFHAGTRTLPPPTTDPNERARALAERIARRTQIVELAPITAGGDLPPMLNADLNPLLDTVEELTTGKARALRRSRIGNARVIRLTELLTQPRRPTRAALAAAVVEVHGKKLPAVPPSVIRHVEEES